MKKYEVRLAVRFLYEVEAQSKEEATDKAVALCDGEISSEPYPTLTPELEEIKEID